MMKQNAALLLLMVAACSREPDERARITVDSTAMQPVAADSPAHKQHPAASQPAGAHDEHAAPTPGQPHQEQHAAAVHKPAEHARAGHAQAGHAQAGHARAADADAHAQHDTTRQAPAHAQHDTTQQAPAHAQHDTAVAQHDTAAHAPTHAEHDTAAHAPAHGARQQHGAHSQMEEDMLMAEFGGITLMSMGQIFPTYTLSLPSDAGTPLEHAELYATQPAIMSNISTPRHGLVLRTTLNFEGITQEDGEITFGGWGEGFIDKRHPHTILHEMMLSANVWSGRSAFSLSGGRGFAAYGTDDPMSRPVLKYPTNHHLSQALERWTLTGMALVRSWSAEASLFGGNEPTGPYDLDNFDGFGNSWSARLTKRIGTPVMATWPWEISLSHAYIKELHDDGARVTRLTNVAVRHEDDYDPLRVYTLLEASRATSDFDEPYYSILGEAAIVRGRHKPYARIEYATRPEYARGGGHGEDEHEQTSSESFFRYDHDDHPIGATRWLIVTAGYGFTLKQARLSPRPYIEAQFNSVRNERGNVDPVELFGRSRFWSISAGMRIFLGGDPMRMGVYGVVDPMTAMHHETHMQEALSQRH